MLILLFFAFLSGLVTILAPCIWPLLPIVLSSSATGGKQKPLGITLGIITSFALFTLTISYLVKLIGFDPDALRIFAVVIIGFLGLTLLIPRLTQILEGFVSRLSTRFGSKVQSAQRQSGFGGGFLTGFALGIVWTPCAGPILATIATLAATRAVTLDVILVTIVYVIGVGIPLFLFAIAGRNIVGKSRFFSKYTGLTQQIFGAVMIVTAILIATNYDKTLQAKLLDAFPSYSKFLYDLEGQSGVKKQLDELKNQEGSSRSQLNLFDRPLLQDFGKAPEFVGIIKWLNVEKPLTISELRGKVVLVDFWTYTCINCIRTLPYIQSWWEKYEDEGLVIIGVHTPEFEFEKKTENVLNAIEQYGLTYPVAQDNNYATWFAYDNQYWPAKYLIDKNGVIRYTHFGEGEYEKTEEVIQKLLAETGAKVEEEMTRLEDETPSGRLTPETYLGEQRMDRFASNENVKGGSQTFTKPSSIPTHYFAYQGTWDVQDEYAQSVKNSALDLHFFADRAFLVITPRTKGNTVKVYLDGKLIPANVSGKDVQNGVVKLDTERLYDLVNLRGQKGDHILRLEFQQEGTKVYAFTFG